MTAHQPEEIWKDVRGYEGIYQASSLGRVRRIVSRYGNDRIRILKHRNPTSKYDYVRVQLSVNGEKKSRGVHVLVAEAFHGRRPRNKFPNHKDGNKVNNSADNLEWLTRKQNAQHGIAIGKTGGRPLPGEMNGRAKLSQQQVTEIRKQKGRIGQRALAIISGVSKTAIQLIHQGKNWSKV